MKKHTLVIGGSRGLGKVVVQQLQEENHTISILARSKPDKLSHYQDIFYIEADLHHSDTYVNKISDIIKTNGKLSNLIFLQRYRGEGDDWEGESEVSLYATRNIINQLKDKFTENASVVMVSSMAGKFATESQPLSYAVAKAGLNQMVQHYAVELGPKKIRVNAVSPCSFIKEESQHYYQENKQLMELYTNIIPLRRMCHAVDVANVILFLCHEKSGFITGQNIIVDGGLSVINHESLARNISCV